MKTSTAIALGVLGFGVLSIGGCALHLVLYPANQAVKVYEKTLDADNIIYNYEYFKQQYQDILAIDKKIINAKSELDNFISLTPRQNWDFQDKQEYSRLTTNLTGLKNVKNEMVATYNARANMVNRKIFMGKDVPAQISEVE